MGGYLKALAGLVYMAVAGTALILALIVLLPSRNLRIRLCNHWGSLTGSLMTWLSGSRVTVEHRERFDGDRPAIYISNHTSVLDIFLGIWLSPEGTVGVAKKEVVYYPFFGQAYFLSGHLMIDRGNRDKAVASMKALVGIVHDYGLSIWMWPEGTRSRTGRLLPFKKGVYHLAVQTGLPVVPVVVKGAHHAWEKGGLDIRGADIHVEVLPAIDTSDWADRDSREVSDELHALFEAHLPEEQRPLAEAA